VRAFEADHDARRLPLGSVRAEALGFLVRGPQSVYFAGDTGLHDDMEILAAEAVDVALIPVAGWGPTLGPGHMDPADAARAVALIQPRIAVPIHWGTLHPLRSAPPTDEPAREFVRHAAELAPDVRCEVLEPGASAEL
jgi:L-ascorbate metabolism protein UlaG (beta-lactamase superfamily)